MSKNVRPAKKVSQLFNTGKILNSPLYSKTKKREIFSGENYAKLTKWRHAYKCYASSYNVGILNSFNPGL